MRQAIITKYLGPTNYREARVKASCEAGSIIVAWDDALNTFDNYEAAIKALCKKLHWQDTWVYGWNDGRMVAVSID